MIEPYQKVNALLWDGYIRKSLSSFTYILFEYVPIISKCAILYSPWIVLLLGMALVKTKGIQSYNLRLVWKFAWRFFRNFQSWANNTKNQQYDIRLWLSRYTEIYLQHQTLLGDLDQKRRFQNPQTPLSHRNPLPQSQVIFHPPHQASSSLQSIFIKVFFLFGIVIWMSRVFLRIWLSLRREFCNRPMLAAFYKHFTG